MAQWVSQTPAVHLLVIESQPLIREALVSALERQSEFMVSSSDGSLDESLLSNTRCQPNVILKALSGRADEFDTVVELVAASGASVALLDERPLDVHARRAIQIGAMGYLTKHQPLLQIATALRLIAAGQRVFAPEIARRLVLTSRGLELLPPKSSPVLTRLTAREVDVLAYVAQGYSVKRCAEALGLSASTVDNHKARLMKKLGVHKAVELAHLALREGLVETRPADVDSREIASHRFEVAHSC